MTRKGETQRLGTLKRQRELQAAIAAVQPLVVALDAAWEAVKGTERECPTCHRPHWDQESPEWAAWGEAFDRHRAAVVEAVHSGAIPFATALQVFKVSANDLEFHLGQRAKQEANNGGA